jgi:hypothetical protein
MTGGEGGESESRKKRWPEGHLYRDAIEAVGLGTTAWIEEQVDFTALQKADLS